MRSLRTQGRYPCDIAETKRFIIRELGLSDINAYIRLTGEEHVREFIPEFRESKECRRENIISHVEMTYAFYECGIFGVFVKPGTAFGKPGALAGLIDLRPLSYEFVEMNPSYKDTSCYELGYVTEKSFIRKGVAAECSRAVLFYAFDYLGADSIIIRTDEENIGAVKTAAALHFNLNEKGFYELLKENYYNCLEK